jgi:hypothetical protein
VFALLPDAVRPVRFDAALYAEAFVNVPVRNDYSDEVKWEGSKRAPFAEKINSKDAAP